MTTSNDSGPRAVVAGHAGFAVGLVEAVGRVSGKANLFRPVTNEGLDAAGVEAVIRHAIAEHGARVVFTDLPAGSCTMAARKIARADSTIAVVTGASVGMLLDFAFGTGDTVEDLQRAATRAREAIIVFPPTGAPRGG
jgi:PTS system N-acetylgalactosamine-specific IIA component